MKILCIGPIWRGSNAGGLFKALSDNGHLIEVIDEYYYIPLKTKAPHLKILNKLTRSQFIQDFNRAIIDKAHRLKPAFCLVYKGAFVLSNTLLSLQRANIKLVNFYPDVSFHTHGKLLQSTLPLYDFIFTTKTFGIKDLQQQLTVKTVAFIPHGYDAHIHRPIPKEGTPVSFSCDVSFIGTWSPKKEKLLNQVSASLPKIRLKIWGSQWEKATAGSLRSCIMHTEVKGDLYAAAICASKINLGILSEKVRGASSGDLITSRTFHIPAAGGFLLHERNEESVLYYREDVEVVFFESSEELIKKIQYYLDYEEERQQIAKAGHERAKKEHSLNQRADQLIHVLKERNIINAL